MGFISAYANELLASILCTTLDSSNTECWLGLSSTIPNLDGSNFTEPQPGPTGYQRVLIGTTNNANSRAMSYPSNGTSSNIKDINFPPVISNYNDIVYIGLFRQREGGVPIYTAPCSTPISTEIGKSITFKAGNTLETSGLIFSAN